MRFSDKIPLYGSYKMMQKKVRMIKKSNQVGPA